MPKMKNYHPGMLLKKSLNPEFLNRIDDVSLSASREERHSFQIIEHFK